PGRVGPVLDGAGAELLLVRGGGAVPEGVAVEARRHLLRGGCAGQQVARELLDGELVERHVAVDRVDDPVAPAPRVAADAVILVAVALGEAGEVEPVPS